MDTAVGTINFTLEPSPSHVELERLRSIFAALIESNALNSRNGQVIMHFDNDGTLKKIETHLCRWLANKENKPKTQIFITPRSIKYANETVVSGQV